MCQLYEPVRTIPQHEWDSRLHPAPRNEVGVVVNDDVRSLCSAQDASVDSQVEFPMSVFAERVDITTYAFLGLSDSFVLMALYTSIVTFPHALNEPLPPRLAAGRFDLAPIYALSLQSVP